MPGDQRRDGHVEDDCDGRHDLLDPVSIGSRCGSWFGHDAYAPQTTAVTSVVGPNGDVGWDSVEVDVARWPSPDPRIYNAPPRAKPPMGWLVVAVIAAGLLAAFVLLSIKLAYNQNEPNLLDYASATPSASR